MNIKEELGVQSFCFRSYKHNEEVAECVKKIGLTKLELCAVHVDFSDVNNHQQVVDTYTQAGVDIISTGVNTLGSKREEVEPFFKFNKVAGADHMSVNFKTENFQESLKLAQELAEEYDMKLGIHNHGGHHWLGSREILRHVFDKTGDRIGLSLDTAWALDAGEDPLAMAREFADRLYCLHFKDFIFDKAGKPEDVVVGEGNLDLEGLYQLLEEINFDGIYVLEYEGEVDNPVPSLDKCVKAMEIK